MKSDQQHLDFLLSQYTDGALDPQQRRLIERRLADDPEARALYKDHRDVQDVLDDFGSRIPLIDWNQFDAQLAQRLAREAGAGSGSRLTRILRPLTAAAALTLAAMVGYTWHGWTQPAGHGPLASQPAAIVPIAEARMEQPATARPRVEMSLPESTTASIGSATAQLAPQQTPAGIAPAAGLAEAPARPDQPRVALDSVRRAHTDAGNGAVTGGNLTPARDLESYP